MAKAQRHSNEKQDGAENARKARKKSGRKTNGPINPSTSEGQPRISYKRNLPVYRTAVKARELASDGGLVPLDVMVWNMRFFANEAETILSGIMEGLAAKRIDNPVVLLDALKQFTGFRMQAQACAVDAAPYMHHRLSSIVIDSDELPSNLVTKVTRRIIPYGATAAGIRAGATDASMV